MGFHNNKTGRYQLYSDSERKAYAQQQREANRQSIMSKWITVWRLKDERKWTDAAIKKYLGTPVEQNGYKVFPVSQIKQVEQSDAFQQWMLPRLEKLYKRDCQEYGEDIASDIKNASLALLRSHSESSAPRVEQILIDALKEVIGAFQPDELAYLALTSKIELPIRDRWAYTVHQLLPNQYVVSREWKRVDLAVVQDRKPVALVELKAMYSYDAAMDPISISGFCDSLERDERKALKLAGDDASVFTVLLATHPRTSVPIEYEQVIKYRNLINRSFRTFGDAHAIEKAANEAVSARFNGKNVIAAGKLPGGIAFDIEVDVLYWVMKA
ncbi:hypothetical protein [Neptuniibacter halophilus]|uniref:hypothetical protein n=1 Tax=Neptuniibacter halophilus TaxID=651666 RepID=UPI00257360A6|nr:hypothetical protein [Neptuniibacter halophilus]